jgi:small subunit ribosomal protein S10
MEEEIFKKIRIKMSSFDVKALNLSCKKIIDAVKLDNSKLKGPIPLPTKKRIYCVLRSPHVNKDSREQFEIRVHKKILDIFPITTNIAFLNIQMPTGVFFEVIKFKK